MGHVQSIEVEGVAVPWKPPENRNESWTYVSKHVIQDNGGLLYNSFHAHPYRRTPIDIIQSSAIRWPENDCLGERIVNPDGSPGQYVYNTYLETFERFVQFGRGLTKLGVNKGDRVGIYANNSIWWQTIAFGSQSIGAIPVPVYDSLGPQASEYIVSHAEISVLFTNLFKFSKAIDLAQKVPAIRMIVVMSDQIPDHGDVGDVQLLTCQKILDDGENGKNFETMPDPDDVALIMYTSGSTGTPKGCVLTNGNIVAGSAGLQCVGTSSTPGDTYLSFLPLAHIYAQAVELEVLSTGARVGYARGGVAQLIDDIRALQPTIMTAAPRILNRVAEVMIEKIQAKPAPVRALIKWAIREKVRCMKENRPHSLFLDAILFAQTRAALGGKMRVLISGGAPIMPEIFEFMCATVTPNILQGCGMTEMASSCFVQEIPVSEVDTVGNVCPCVELKLRRVAEVPEYDPQGEEPTGEAVVRGPNRFRGYHKQDELTRDAILDGGWLATGDVVRITKGMQCKIIDRVKQLVKLSQGEYVSLTTLTEFYGMADAVDIIYVHADSRYNEPIAIVWPKPALIQQWSDSGISDIENSEPVKKIIIESLRKVHTERKLLGFERINHILVRLDPPTVENGLLTPTLKAQLRRIEAKYRADLNELYAQTLSSPST
jgi:long-chain acyl-CoA synthetase